MLIVFRMTRKIKRNAILAHLAVPRTNPSRNQPLAFGIRVEYYTIDLIAHKYIKPGCGVLGDFCFILGFLGLEDTVNL